MQQRWAPSHHAVFELVPSEFGQMAEQLYVAAGSPVVTSYNVWDVYSALLQKFRDLPELPDYSNVVASQAALHSEEVELLPGLRNLRHGEEAAGPNGLCYMGGLDDPGAAASPETPV